MDNSLVFTIKKYILSQLRLKNLICLSFHLELSRYDTEVRSGVWHWFDRFQNIDHLERVHRTRGHISSIKIDRCRLNSRQFFFVVVMEHLDNGIVYHVNSHSMVSLLSLNGLNILDKIDIFSLFSILTHLRGYIIRNRLPILGFRCECLTPFQFLYEFFVVFYLNFINLSPVKWWFIFVFFFRTSYENSPN